jgi:predicted ATP-grasp superfamily ATP-dependent carboligase
MRLNKSAAIKTINQSKSITATRVSPDELPQDRTKKVKEIQQEIEKRTRQNKDLTIVIVE